MSDHFVLIEWTPYKRRYDLTLLACLALYIATFFLVSFLRWTGPHALSPEVVLLRATATAAILMLHITLSLGPLARLNKKFLPLLYNRRHLGVATFFVALTHAILAIGYYHGFGRIGAVRSVLTSNVQYRSISGFPFEILGGIALLILFAMAATSHDFWLKKLSPRVWKSLHMLVYVAWLAVVLHVALGALQSERSFFYAGLLIAGVVWIAGLHLIAGRREVAKDRRKINVDGDWIDAGLVGDLPEGRAKTVCGAGKERIALYRHEGRISALTNLCAHQGGPIGEGKLIDGCITCPWHGFTYRPEDGCAPPPFTEKIATYAIRIEGGRVFVNVNALPPGTRVEPAVIEEACDAIGR